MSDYTVVFPISRECAHQVAMAHLAEQSSSPADDQSQNGSVKHG